MLLHAKNLTKSFPRPGQHQPLTVLNSLNLQVESGASLAVVGPSGSGKSTLLNLLGGLDQPTSGEILFDQQNIADLSEPERARWRNQKIGFVFQEHHLLPQLTVLENVLMPTLAFSKTSPEASNKRAAQLLETVGLQERIDHHPAQLSGGEKQRVALVRALINQPALLFADEPTGSLDQETAVSLSDLLLDLNQQEHIALVTVTHSIELAKKMNTVYRLQDGKLVEDGAA